MRLYDNSKLEKMVAYLEANQCKIKEYSSVFENSNFHLVQKEMNDWLRNNIFNGSLEQIEEEKKNYFNKLTEGHYKKVQEKRNELANELVNLKTEFFRVYELNSDYEKKIGNYLFDLLNKTFTNDEDFFSKTKLVFLDIHYELLFLNRLI